MSNLIPEGIYKVRATQNWALSETTKGTPYVRLEFDILDGPAKGQKISRDFFLSDKTWEKTVESLRTCGWQGDDVSNLAGVDANEVVAKIVHEMITDKNGNPVTDNEGHARYRAAVAWVGKDRTPKPLEASKLSDFRQLMKARLQSLAEPELGKTGTDDDMPDFLR